MVRETKHGEESEVLGSIHIVNAVASDLLRHIWTLRVLSCQNNGPVPPILETKHDTYESTC